MKWTDDKVEKLTFLVESGLRPNEIAKIFDTSYKSINNKMYRLGLKVIFEEKRICRKCENEFITYISDDRSFCSKSCSASYNNEGRTLSEKTKNKISETLKKKPKKEKQKKHRLCKICNTNYVNVKHKRICNNCKLEYYEYYRPSCVFNFDPYDFPEEFDLMLVEEHGWYSPSNKGDNLYGISKDHKFSVMEGFRNNIDPKIISHPANCELMLFSNNSIKKDNSSITLDELQERIKLWDMKYKVN